MGKLNYAVLFLGFLVSGLPAAAEDVWHLLPEPKFFGYEAAWPIEGSQKTVLVPAREKNGEIHPLRQSEIQERGISREAIEATAYPAAAKVLEGLIPQYVRDERGVIQYAILESDNPLTASAVLAPEFADVFAETLGPDLLVAIPHRNRIYVFSKQSPVYRHIAEQVIVDYASSSYPVSKEVFAVKNGQLSAIGRYR